MGEQISGQISPPSPPPRLRHSPTVALVPDQPTAQCQRREGHPRARPIPALYLGRWKYLATLAVGSWSLVSAAPTIITPSFPASAIRVSAELYPVCIMKVGTSCRRQKLATLHQSWHWINQELAITSMGIPKKSEFLVIGAGVHGLSTAYHLAKYLRRTGKGSGSDVLVVEKSSIAAGASGVACGNVRNNYFQEPMTRLMMHCIDIWESDPDFFAYQGVGYLTASFAPMREGLEAVYQRHQQLGYPSTLIVGKQSVRDYMQTMFYDWQAEELEVVLHEHRGGHAWSRQAIHGLAIKAEREDVRSLIGVGVTGFRFQGDGSVNVVETDVGDIEVGHVVVAVGPWIGKLWPLLELPGTVDDPQHPGDETNLWRYLALQEGEIEVNPYLHITNDGRRPSLIHVDSDVPLYGEEGQLVWDKPWGIYFKRDKHAVQGGAVPVDVGTECQIDPYGTRSPHYCVKDSFYDLWVASLAHCMKRYEGKRSCASAKPSGGVGCFSADNFPVFDFMRPNVYVIADSNHGFKMIGVGEQVARILIGEKSELLEPFRFRRFEDGDALPKSNAPFPWM